MKNIVEGIEQVSRDIDEKVTDGLSEIERMSNYFDNFKYTYIPDEGELICLDKSFVSNLSDILNNIENILNDIQRDTSLSDSDYSLWK